MGVVARIAYDNLVRASGSVLTASASDPSFPVSRLLDQLRSDVWRSPIGWTVKAGVNDAVCFAEGGVLRVGFVSAGEYATGAEYAAAIATAMDAAGYPGNVYASCKAWYRADKGVTVDADGVVTAWADQSGNGYNLTPGASVAPVFRSNQINGRPSILLDSEQVGVPNFSGGTLAQLFDASGDGCVIMVVRTPAAQSATERFLFGSSAANQNALSYTASADTLKSATYDGAAKSVTKSVTWDAWTIVCFQRSSDATAYAGVNDLDTAALASVALGGALTPSGTSRFFVTAADVPLGEVAEIIIYNAAAFSSTNRQSVVAYLEAKYGLSTDTTAPTWTNTYSGSYASSKPTLARATGAATVALLWSTGSHKEASVAVDAGFSDAADDTGATSYTADEVAYQSRHWLKLDAGEAKAAQHGIALEHNAGTGGTFTLQGHTADLWDDPDVDEAMAGDADIRIKYLTASTSKRWWRLVIDDVQNEDGFCELGVWSVGPIVQTAKQYSRTYSKRAVHYSAIVPGEQGAHYQQERQQGRAWDLSWRSVIESDKEILEAVELACPLGHCFFFSFDAVADSTKTAYVSLVSPVDTSPSGEGLLWNVSFQISEALG